MLSDIYTYGIGYSLPEESIFFNAESRKRVLDY